MYAVNQEQYSLSFANCTNMFPTVLAENMCSRNVGGGIVTEDTGWLGNSSESISISIASIAWISLYYLFVMVIVN